MINPVQDITPDGRPMEETAYLEHLAPGASLDSGLRAGMSSIELPRQSVLYMTSVIRPDETDRPEHQALASQMHHEQSRSKSSARPMLDPDLNVYTDVNMDINTDLPESIAPMINSPRENSAPMMDSDLIVLNAVRDTAALLNSQRDHKQSHGDLSARPILDPDVVVHSDVNGDIEADRPEKSVPRTNSDLILTELNNAIRREVLGGPTADKMLLRGMQNRVVLSEDISLNVAEMFMDPVRSVRSRRWSMGVDVVDPLHTISGMSGRKCTMLTHSHADDRETRSLDAINMWIRTVSGNDPETHDEEVDIAGLCRCPEIQEGEDPPELWKILQLYSGLDKPEQAELNVVISECMVDLDDTDYDSDTDSIAELEFYTWDDAGVWEFLNTVQMMTNVRRDSDMPDMPTLLHILTKGV